MIATIGQAGRLGPNFAIASLPSDPPAIIAMNPDGALRDLSLLVP